MDQLFKLIFQSNWIKYNIFKHLKVKGSKKYNEITLEWILMNRQYSLLRDMIARDHFLLFTPLTCLKLLFSIKDLELFKICFDRYQEYYPIEYPPILDFVCHYDNQLIFNHVKQMSYKSTTISIQECVFNENLNLLKQLDIQLDQINIYIIILAIESKNLEILTFLFDKIDFNQLPRQDCLTILKEAIKSGNLEIFKLLFSCKLNGDESLLFDVLFEKYLNNYQVFKYLYEIHNQLVLDHIKSIFYYSSIHGCLDIIKFIINNQSLGIVIDKPAIKKSIQDCFVYNHLDLVCFLKDLYLKNNNDNGNDNNNHNNNLLNDIDILSIITDITLEKIKFIHKEIGIPIEGNNLIKAGKLRLEVFIYIWENVNQDQRIEYEKPMIFESLCNPRVLNYLVKEIDFNSRKNIVPISWLQQVCYSDKNLPFIDTVLRNREQSSSDNRNLILCIKSTIIQGKFKIFSRFYQELEAIGADEKDFSKIISLQDISLNLEILDFLQDKGIKQFDYTLNNACKFHNLHVIKDLVEKGFPFSWWSFYYAANRGDLQLLDYLIKEKQKSNPNLVIQDDVLFIAISSNKIDIVKYLLENHSFYPSQQILLALGQVLNLDILKLVYEYWKKNK
ncbi:hypothetical protein CYY_004581 [Polysphondylium violaceum]|uniref:Ankyrin repeat-containing protein n=1 Tax=Polysphondylium violaceum TaxID=133409 RepID=A0A8J4Q532_9MYCE|nr:hypothetical protein CYY_004581 [Polysphondylium violaceum]